MQELESVNSKHKQRQNNNIVITDFFQGTVQQTLCGVIGAQPIDQSEVAALWWREEYLIHVVRSRVIWKCEFPSLQSYFSSGTIRQLWLPTGEVGTTPLTSS